MLIAKSPPSSSLPSFLFAQPALNKTFCWQPSSPLAPHCLRGRRRGEVRERGGGEGSGGAFCRSCQDENSPPKCQVFFFGGGAWGKKFSFPFHLRGVTKRNVTKRGQTIPTTIFSEHPALQDKFTRGGEKEFCTHFFPSTPREFGMGVGRVVQADKLSNPSAPPLPPPTIFCPRVFTL